MLVDTELKTLTIKIDNFNNKLSADSFLHIWKTLGSFDGNAMINDYQYQIHGNDKTWRIHDIGKIALKELPAWMMEALGENAGLILRADNEKSVAVIPLKTLLELMQ